MTRAPELVRGVGLRGALAINVITMVGIGPLITIPLVLGALHGPLSLIGWIAGALLALCDGLVWAELGSRYPGSGGTYAYLREAFGAHGLGRMLAFLFVWQTIFSAPLLLATGYIGFASYAGYLVPHLTQHPHEQQALAVGVGIVTILALYRGIVSTARIGTALFVAVLVTLLAVIAGAFARFSPAVAFAAPSHALGSGFAAGFGAALVIAMYDYAGYGQSSAIGGEVVAPQRTIPRSIVIAIGLVAALYVALQCGVLGAIPWQRIVPAHDGTIPPLGQYVGSAVVERAFGALAAGVVTVLILITAFASVYGNLLGFSRIPFAAAVDGVFLKPFAHVHERLRFPDVSLLAIGILALPASLFSLGDVINALTAGMVLIQSIAQICAVFVLRARGERAPYRMRLFPLTALVALAGWLYVFVGAGGAAMLYGAVWLAAGAIVFLARAGRRSEWPFVRRSAPDVRGS
ncbi:MAG TPA: APC family permease [Candidatus Baltobacteraceae bacterium]|nr:APC family permease [Candidatus Baltobacteraceae bacterium]